MAKTIIDGYAKAFAAQKNIAEQAFGQLDEKGIRWQPAANLNTAAMLIKHLAGHLHSRFADFTMSDGEKPGRDKAQELADEPVSIAALKEMWDNSWRVVFSALDDMNDDDVYLDKTLRGERMTVAEYLPRVLSHTAYHTGQIVLLAKLHLGDRWRGLA